MDRVRNIGSAAALASIAGGPMLLVVTAIGALLSGDPVHIDSDLALQTAGALTTVSVIAWFVAIVPNLVGSIVLGLVGGHNVGMRMPAVWAIVGAAAAGIPTWLTSGTYKPTEMTAAMAGIGAISALLCRARVRWDDASAAPPSPNELTPAHPRATP